MTEKEIIRNKVLAENVIHYQKTVAVLCDDRPGFEIKEARRIIAHLREQGYYVHEITVDYFLNALKHHLGFLLIIPHASSLPAVCSGKLNEFVTTGGSVLTFGGVLFGKYVEKVDGKWTEIPLPDNIFDAVHTGDGSKPKAEPIVIEGIVPTYKTYRCNDAIKFTSNSLYTSAMLSTDEELRVVCPVARPYGGGYNMGYRNRYIPITTINGKSDRGDGSEGAAAFMMLSDTMGHEPTTNIVFAGTVGHTNLGSVAANIGIMRQDLMDIEGVPQLITDIVDSFCRGLHIFSAGAEKFTYSDGERAVFGASVHNCTVDYKPATVTMTVEKQGEAVYSYTEELLCAPFGYTDCTFVCEGFKADEYIVRTTLSFEGKVIDTTTQEIHKKEVVKGHFPEDFVRVEGDNFMLGDKVWYPIGMNYWPLYMPGFERPHYWLCWLDKSNYIPEEIEKDLALMEKMGINCLYMRIDGDIFQRQRSTFEDFLIRCRRHNMKLCFSYCNITTPNHYSGAAFRKLMKEFDLLDDPIIFSHDITWETDGGFMATPYIKRYDEAWQQWLIDRYGSLENAEADFGMKLDRREDGVVTCINEFLFKEEGDWRVQVTAYRRFEEDYMSKMWREAIEDIRLVDPKHLVSYRRGPIGSWCKDVKPASKHVDYNSHEAYHITLGDGGYHEACANAAYFDMISRNKPLIWSEYGLTLTGMNRTNDFVWDHETERPMAFRMKMTEEYNQQMQKAFARTGVKGTAPWYWPGGLRMVEMSDCGYCGPDGILRPFGKDYAKFISEYFHNPNKPTPGKYRVKIDVEQDARGYYSMFRERLVEEDRKAEEMGCVLELYTDGTGTTSANTPLTAVGNMPYNGNNPPKFLNGEFNSLTLFVNGVAQKVAYGSTVRVPAGATVEIEASLGNLKDATWLSPLTHKGDGGVYMVSNPDSDISVKTPILTDTPFLEDTVTQKAAISLPAGESKIALRLSAENRADFGEVFRFRIIAE